uniref:Uncharacterized protein n=1 Tax=Parascaris equorum TaxID=6256 RepID=A0A914RBK2_PAREQ
MIYTQELGETDFYRAHAGKSPGPAKAILIASTVIVEAVQHRERVVYSVRSRPIGSVAHLVHSGTQSPTQPFLRRELSLTSEEQPDWQSTAC